MTKIIKKEKQRKYTIALSFEDKEEYEYAMESWREYPKLKRLCEEFEDQLRSWRKYDSIPESMRENIDDPSVGLKGHEIEQWWYKLKKEWIND